MALDSNYVTLLSQKLRKFVRKRKSLTPDRVHKLRTNIRRLETATEAISPKLGRQEKACLKDVRGIRKQAGKVRDMDVLVADATGIRMADDSRDELVQLVEHLGSERHKEARRLNRLIKKKGLDVHSGVKRLSKELCRRLQRTGKSDPISDVIATTVNLLSDLRNPSRLSKRNLHPYRLKVKKLTDVVRLSPQTGHSKLAKMLGTVKDAIGDWHDWEVLGSIADEVLAESSRDGLTKVIKRTAERKYECALSLARRMRREFLGPRKTRGLKESVIRTTSGIAN